jgi:hypothetical protein
MDEKEERVQYTDEQREQLEIDAQRTEAEVL